MHSCVKLRTACMHAETTIWLVLFYCYADMRWDHHESYNCNCAPNSITSLQLGGCMMLGCYNRQPGLHHVGLMPSGSEDTAQGINISLSE